MKEIINQILINTILALLSWGLTNWKQPTDAIFIPPVAIAFYILLYVLIFHSPLTTIFQKYIYPYSALKGYWLEKLDDWERPWSIAKIEVKKSRWSYSGVAYDKSYDVKARWKSHDIHYSNDHKIWLFFGNSYLLYKNKPEEIAGYVCSFLYYGENDEGGSSNGFKGRITDLTFKDNDKNNDKPKSTNIILYRISKDDWQEISSRKKTTYLSKDKMSKLVEIITNRNE